METQKPVSETEKINKAYHEMVPVELTLPKRFYDFIKGYLQFFAYKTTVEGFCRDTVFDAIKVLYKQLDSFATEGTPTYIPDFDWFRRWDNLAFITVPDDKNLPSYEFGVQFGNKEFLEDMDKAAEKEHMDRDEFIRSVMRRELEKNR